MSAGAWWIIGLYVLAVGALIIFAVYRGRKAHRKAEEDFRKVGRHHYTVHRVYGLARRRGATEDEAWAAARAYEQHYADNTVNKQ